MCRIFLLLLALTITTFAGLKSLEVQPRIQWSKFGGKEARDYEDEVGKTFHPTAGVVLGVALPIQKSNLLTYVPEFRLNFFGSRYTIADSTTYLAQPAWVEGEFTDKVLFLEAPFLVRFTFPIKKITAYATAGAYVGVRLVQYRNGYNDIYTSFNTKNEVYDNLILDTAYAPVNGGVVLGGGAQLPLPKGYLIFDLRYDGGIIPMTIYEGITVRNTLFSFSVGYGFIFNRKEEDF